ncbi:MAG: DUF5107 domain-containing protein, partial [Armatimonadetes bacterium]|nr:DUF5107 domain-containing protein [Armatimonadota bacterium]
MPPVSVSETTLLFPSYPLGRPDREPPLQPEFAPRGQPIYPYPTIESYARTPETRSLRAVILENEFLRLTFLPEINARLWSIWDKLADCEALYANPELKPGLVGLRGCWYATGIEVNFPCSHTVTTTDEIPHEVFVDDAGAAHFVAWDVEAVSGMSWQCITTLAPGSAAVGMETRLANPTDLPHRWFFWVNAAYPIHEGTRFVLPPSTTRIFNEGGGAHGLAGFLGYPDNHGEDIGLLSNLKQHSAFFAVAPDEGFFGLQHTASDTGIAHVADPSLVHGRKLWSWGCAPDGLVWREVLTDTGGQYCEVQSGPLPSQLEYRMLAPGQVMVQRDTWLPLRGLGGLSHASADAALSWELVSGAVRFNVLTAAEQPGATVRLDGPQAMEYVLDLGPRATPVELRLLSPEEHRVTLLDATGLPLVESVPLSPAPSREPHRIRAARPATAFQRARWHEWCGARRAAEKL